MTMSVTSRKVESNRQNSQLSTGPRTPAGKATVRANAVKHGMTATAPVVAGESAGEWEAHRSGIFASLVPVGTLEERLAGRVATLLWRLGWVEKFEAGVVTAAVHAVQGDGQPADDSSVQLLGKQRTFLARLEAAVQTLGGLAQLGDDAPVPPGVAFSAVESAFAQVPDDSELPYFDTAGFLALLGFDGETRFSEAPWTAGLLRRALTVVAKHLSVSVVCVTRRAAREAESERDTCRGRVDALAAEVRARQRRERVAASKRLSAALLPDDATAAKVERYEGHLARQMYQALHELERIQARRAGRNVSLPGALDIGVSVSPAGDVGD
jgi:hypothetical protein